MRAPRSPTSTAAIVRQEADDPIPERDAASRPRRGWSARGERAYGSVPCGHWERVTILGALGAEGMLGAMSIAAATDGAVFHAEPGPPA